jgi:hypothetical protein
MLKEGVRGSPRVAAIFQSLEDALDEYERKKPQWFTETGERLALRISSPPCPASGQVAGFKPRHRAAQLLDQPPDLPRTGRQRLALVSLS